MEKQDNLNTSTTTIPLPEMWAATSNGQGALPQNPWEVRLESVPIHAEKQFYALGRNVGLPLAGRSPLRHGEMHFAPQGISIHGMETRPNKILQAISAVLSIIFYAGQFGISSVLRGGRSVLGIACGIWLTAVAGVIAINIYHERRRFPIESTIRWQDVHGILLDKNLKWITLVLTIPNQNPKLKPTYQFLSLNQLEPAMVTGVSDTILHYAPHVIRKSNAFKDWILSSKIAAILGAVIALGAIGFLIWLILKLP